MRGDAMKHNTFPPVDLSSITRPEVLLYLLTKARQAYETTPLQYIGGVTFMVNVASKSKSDIFIDGVLAQTTSHFYDVVARSHQPHKFIKDWLLEQAAGQKAPTRRWLREYNIAWVDHLIAHLKELMRVNKLTKGVTT
jgi:hypothetical protein